MRFHSILTALFLLYSVSGISQPAALSARDLYSDVRFLASDSLRGRKPGTPEMAVAAAFIRDHFKADGLKLMGDEGYQWVEIVTDVSTGEGNNLSFEGSMGILRKDFIPLSFSSNGTLNAPVIFAGYGFDIETDSLKWSDYKGLDVAGKWVMVLRADPELDNPGSKFIPYSDIRSKVLTAKDRNAAGILLVTPRGYEKEDKLIPLTTENNDITGGIPVINISRNFADKILKSKDINIDSLERLMVQQKQPYSFATGINLTGSADLIQKKEKTANVIALLEGYDPVFREEYLVIGAHYDHLGMGGPGSGSRMPDTNAVHNGADDNASGTAMVLELARYFASTGEKPKRSMIFVAFTGEEMGLIGSKYFVGHPPIELKKIKAMFNFDMVGRFDKEKNSISVSGTGTSVEADSLMKLQEPGLSFSVVHSPDGYGPSDHAAFYTSNIPVLFFNTGVHTDYHTPLDDTDKLDFEAEQEIGAFAVKVIRAVDDFPRALTFKESGKKDGTGRGGRKLKVTLGIMPDFAGTERKGLRVDGITKDGPADKGGLKKGDIITGINGLPVGNIYEYMSRLQKLKHGMTISVEIIREEKQQVLIIQL
ncbi:MAG: M20/M25/M40 family metallo-hydrolase [Bacteroidales bacterium]|nr:M20/M25/M40 family metallo-hydrolase [Bacteroidales bacterium]